MASESVENYLKAIYEIAEQQERVTTGAIAERLGIASPSVTAMLKRLSDESPALVNYTPHRGVDLTDDGRRRALGIIRRHRLVETFLCQVLGYSWDEVHEEAERLEHHISARFEDRIARLLDHPEADPHGAPIPTREGTVAPFDAVALCDIDPPRTVRVRRIAQDDSDLLRYLTSLGIAPETTLRVDRREPFEGPVFVEVLDDAGATTPQVIGHRVAASVLVWRE